ncbi:MAG: DNA mismatch repair protein MutS [Bacteroidales bacterium]|nr:DNA mismatch repair protein MutS [Bacteroidales bacterium]
MTVKDKIKSDPGFQYVIDNIDLMSSVGRRVMLNMPWLCSANAIEARLNDLEAAIAITQRPDTKHSYNDLRHRLMELHDIQGTLNSLSRHTVIEEVELFEIKAFTHIVMQARRSSAELGLDHILNLPDLSAVFALLDPDRTGIANFYIYDSYDNRLPSLRAELRAMQTRLAGLAPQDGDYNEVAMRVSDLLSAQNEIQNQVCVALSNDLYGFCQPLVNALEQMGYADYLLALAVLCIDWQMCRPSIGSVTEFQGLVNPRLKHRNEEAGLRYQPVDVQFGNGVTLVTGANMAGKTVLLKSISTAQTMFQFGMYLPANMAVMTVVDNVYTSIGDEQDEMNGLSSFASEIIKISDAVRLTVTSRLLVLIDEPARTTNPVEGKAIVQSLISIMQSRPSPTIVTTHYSQLGTDCRRLRVKGFVETMADVPLTPGNINRFIDYSLVADQSDDVPHEALRIASILGCESSLVEGAYSYLESR